jgi:hypothetical protein
MEMAGLVNRSKSVDVAAAATIAIAEFVDSRPLLRQNAKKAD